MLGTGYRLVPLSGTFSAPKAGAALVEAGNYAASIAAARRQFFDHGPPREGDAPHIATEG